MLNFKSNCINLGEKSTLRSAETKVKKFEVELAKILAGPSLNNAMTRQLLLVFVIG
jgi:hypothetical protein